jgi:hypothetical protein
MKNEKQFLLIEEERKDEDEIRLLKKGEKKIY